MPSPDDLRRRVDELVRLANVDLTALWGQVGSAQVAAELLADILPELVAVYGSAAAELAADWYDELRVAEEISGRFRALAAELPDIGRTQSLAGWATSGLAPDDLDAGLLKAQGGLQRIIANASRDTVMQSSVADRQADGWQRSASGGCGFCRMLASRGAVYTSGSVDFGAHDHCRCVAVPAFAGQARLVKPYTPTERDVTDADRERTRLWMADHGY